MPGGQGPKTVKGAQSDPNYASRLLARSECLPGGPIIIVTPLPGSRAPCPSPLNAAVARGGAVQLRDVEAELEAEQRRGRELQAENRKLSRSLQELRTQSDDERRAMNELADQVNTLQLRIKTLRRQLEEAVCLVHICYSQDRAALHARGAKMRYIVTDVPWSLLLSVSVCLLDITMSCARMEPIEMPFGVLARVSPVNGPHQGEGQF